jgi:hypothetical protein
MDAKARTTLSANAMQLPAAYYHPKPAVVHSFYGGSGGNVLGFTRVYFQLVLMSVIFI